MEKVGEHPWITLPSWFEAPQARVIARLNVYVRKREEYEVICYYIEEWQTYGILQVDSEPDCYNCGIGRHTLYVSQIPRNVVLAMRKKRGNKKWTDLFSVRTVGFTPTVPSNVLIGPGFDHIICQRGKEVDQLVGYDLLVWDQASQLLLTLKCPTALTLIICDYFVDTLHSTHSALGTTYYKCNTITKEGLDTGIILSDKDHGNTRKDNDEKHYRYRAL